MRIFSDFHRIKSAARHRDRRQRLGRGVRRIASTSLHEATCDEQWIHVDQERVQERSCQVAPPSRTGCCRWHLRRCSFDR